MKSSIFAVSLLAFFTGCATPAEEEGPSTSTDNITANSPTENTVDFRVGTWEARAHSSTSSFAFPCVASPSGGGLVCVPEKGASSPNPLFLHSVVEFENGAPIETSYNRKTFEGTGLMGRTRREAPPSTSPSGGIDFGTRLTIKRNAEGVIVKYSFDDHAHPGGTAYRRTDLPE